MAVIENSSNVGGIMVMSGVAGAVLIFIRDSLVEMVPYFVLALLLVVCDLYFGCRAAVARGEIVRPSRALRRTVGKIVEYLCWVTVATAIAVAFGVSWPQWALLGIVMGNEVLSMITNWLEMHGKRLRGLNVFEIVGKKTGLDLTGVQIENIGDDGNTEEAGRDENHRRDKGEEG